MFRGLRNFVDGLRIRLGIVPLGVPSPGARDRIVIAPPETYAERLEAVRSVVAECMHLSRRNGGVPSPTGRHYWASVLFTSMVMRAVTLVFIAPYSPWSRRAFEHWDHASVANIARTVMETRLNYYYLCGEDLAADEWGLRWNLFNLHDCCARSDLMAVLGHDDQVKLLQEQAGELRARLTTNPQFQLLPEKRQRELLRGKKAHLRSLEEIAVAAGIDLRTFKMMWQLMSSNIHALPFSFYRVGESRGTGVQTELEENYSVLLLSFVLVLLTGARDEYSALMAPLSRETD